MIMGGSQTKCFAKFANTLPVWGFNCKYTTASQLASCSNWKIKTWDVVRWEGVSSESNCCHQGIINAVLPFMLKWRASWIILFFSFSNPFSECSLHIRESPVLLLDEHSIDKKCIHTLFK